MANSVHGKKILSNIDADPQGYLVVTMGELRDVFGGWGRLSPRIVQSIKNSLSQHGIWHAGGESRPDQKTLIVLARAGTPVAAELADAKTRLGAMVAKFLTTTN